MTEQICVFHFVMHYPADRVKVNHHAVYLGQKVIVRRDRQTHTHTVEWCSTWATKIVVVMKVVMEYLLSDFLVWSSG